MPRFKSISFPGAPHPVALKFADDDPLFERVGGMTSGEVREAVGCETYADLIEHSRREDLSPHAFIHERLEKALGRKPKPYAGWPAGSAEKDAAAKELVRQVRAKNVLDPFAGRADYAAAAAQVAHVRAMYCEISPVFRVVAEARNRALFCTPAARDEVASELVEFADGFDRRVRSALPDPLLVATRRQRGEEEDASAEVAAARDLLERIRTAIDDLPSVANGIAAAAVVEALPRATGDLNRKQFVREVRSQLRSAADFLRNEEPLHAPVMRIANDARDLPLLQPLAIDCVITNPPSLNFAPYALPLAMWFLGARRPRSRRLLDPGDAIAVVRRSLGANGKRAATRIESELRALRRNQRMARVVANYFCDMAEVLAAVVSQMTAPATFAIDISESNIAGVDIDTPDHLEAMLRAFGFRRARDIGQFQVLAR